MAEETDVTRAEVALDPITFGEDWNAGSGSVIEVEGVG